VGHPLHINDRVRSAHLIRGRDLSVVVAGSGMARITIDLPPGDP
jgi:hypothetical protein